MAHGRARDEEKERRRKAKDDVVHHRVDYDFPHLYVVDFAQPPDSPTSAGFVIWRLPARPWICWIESVWFQKRVRPPPMLPPLGDTGFAELIDDWRRADHLLY